MNKSGKIKHFFGNPKLGIHSYRLFNIAIIDVLLTIFASLIIKYFFQKLNLFIINLFLFSLGIFIHYIFSVETTINKLIKRFIKKL